MSTTIRGLSAFPITPSDDSGRIDTAGLQMLLEQLVSAGVDSIGLLGSTGSYPFFTRAERRRAIEAAVECVAGRVPLLVGVGALRTDEAVALAADAVQAGAAAGLLAPVSYAPLQDEEVFQHFQAVASTGLPLCIYNIPGTTHFTFSTALVGRLAALPGVVAVKNPAPISAEIDSVLAALRAVVPAEFSVGFSVDLNAAAALLAGGDAWYSVLAGIYPATCLRLTRAAQAGQVEEVNRLSSLLKPVGDLFATHTSFRVVHHAATLAGIPNARPVRPVLALSGDAARQVTRVLEDLALG
jgi:4-hydroxy-tetrahydrodipicolinate synthase